MLLCYNINSIFKGNYIMNFLLNLKAGLVHEFSQFFKIKNYLTRPVFIAYVYYLIFVLVSNYQITLNGTDYTSSLFTIYSLLIIIYNGLSELYVSDDSTNDVQKMNLQFKNKSGNIVDVPIEVAVSETPIRREYAYELLFRERDSRIIKAYDEKDAIEKAKLSVSDKEDLMGIELI